jgi:hypothetical protein
MAGRLDVKLLRPIAVGSGRAGRAVIAADTLAAPVAERDEGVADLRVEGRDGHLYVYDIFGGEAGHGGRTDVVNAHGEVSQRLP